MRFTARADGDFGIGAADSRDGRMRAVVDRPWQTARQVHGSRVVVVDRTTERCGDADALVTTDPTIALAVRTADCAAIALASDEGVVAITHAGWRGLVAGVI